MFELKYEVANDTKKIRIRNRIRTYFQHKYVSQTLFVHTLQKSYIPEKVRT